MTTHASLPCRLTRRDPALNMARFYSVAVQPTLFGEVSVTRAWGRIGRPGRFCIETFGEAAAALASAERLIRVKQRRGYGVADDCEGELAAMSIGHSGGCGSGCDDSARRAPGQP